MKTFKYITVLVFTISASSLLAQVSVKIDPVEFKASYFKYKGLLIDTRTPQEYNQGHVEGAQNIDVSDPESFEKHINAIEKDKPVFVYCAIGVRSARAASILRKKGFTKVYDLSGGYEDLVKAGMKSIR
jgi:rhodanese-related sulfurtransferase